MTQHMPAEPVLFFIATSTVPVVLAGQTGWAAPFVAYMLGGLAAWAIGRVYR